MVKNLPATQETRVRSLGQEDPLEKGMATHSRFLPGELHVQRSFCLKETFKNTCYLHLPVFLLFLSSPINAKKVNTTTSSDSYIGLWRNYLLLCCSAATSAASSTSAGSVRCSPPETLASTPDSGYSIDSKVSCLVLSLNPNDSIKGMF